MIADRILNRASRELVSRLGVPPRWCGYRHLRPAWPNEFDYRELDPPGVSIVPLPRNVASREALSRDAGITGFSFHDVPRRDVAPTYLATIRDCRVLTATDSWGDRHYAILTSDDRDLRARGTAFQRALHAPLLKTPAVRLDRATWILEAWDRNYAHWLQWHLTKIVLLQKHGLADGVIVPPPHGVVAESLELLGMRGARELREEVLAVGELTVVGIDSYRASLLRDLRARLAPAGVARRKLFISRRGATRRRLLNEERCWAMLEARGYERVVMEDYRFAQQIALMGEAAAVVALHGAGLANILFAPEGARVVEIADASFPNPQYYALAGAMGHEYALVPAQPAGDLRPGYHDLVVDEDLLRSQV